MAALAIDLSGLTGDIPKGAWVAVAHDWSRVLSYGSEMNKVFEKAHNGGEPDPIIIKIPETNTAVML